MISADSFLQPARRLGFEFFTGVPCSFLTPFINRTISDESLSYVGATSEGEAVAIAAGAWLAGRKSVVMFQNSGLGNAVNPLTSLNFPFRIPVLIIVTWRGQPELPDEPQHELMGAITPSLLDLLKVPHLPFPQDNDAIGPTLEQATRAMSETLLPFALIMENGSVESATLAPSATVFRSGGAVQNFLEGSALPARHQVLSQVLASVVSDAAIVATTGKTGRELFTLDDRAQHLYMVGAMGSASGMGLGIAMNSDRPVFVLDGDGAALMKLGTLATIGAQRPANLTHILLDNGIHDSTGGQATVSATVDFASLAQAAHYRGAFRCDSISGFAQAMSTCAETPGPHFIHVRIGVGSMANLGRPTIRPSEVARRFRTFLAAPK
jgi:phosphonopyruvate decarboxylase